MSLPRFPDVPEGYTINDSIAQIITSIAMEEIGLSHIINAEGEKIQYVLGTLEGQNPPEPPTFEQVLEMNESVKDMLSQVSFSQMFLMGKMQAALNAYQDNQTPTPANENILVAAGRGHPEILTQVNMMPVPFATPLLQIGNYVSEENPYEFIINTTGRYQINYQLLASESASTGAVNMTGELISAYLGVIDTFTVPTNQNTNLVQRSVTVDLKAGDKIDLIVRTNSDDVADAALADIEVDSQAITFVKVE